MESFPNLAILISGNGTNLQSIIDHIQSGKLEAKISIVISNKPEALGLQKANLAGIPVAVVSHADYSGRDNFDQALLHVLEKYEVDWIILAGFMRILGTKFLNQYPQRILNIHPSLLPKYPGMNAIQKAWQSGEKQTGVTVHYVSPDMDSGEVIIQEKVPMIEGETLESLESRIHQVEHQIYPKAIQKVLKGKMRP